MLQPAQPAAWRTVIGGSRAYVKRLDHVLRRPDQAGRGVVTAVQRTAGGVMVTRRAAVNRVATTMSCSRRHADQALALLADPTPDETRASRRIPLQPQSRGSAFRSEPYAEAARRLVELELYRPRGDDDAKELPA